MPTAFDFASCRHIVEHVNEGWVLIVERCHALSNILESLINIAGTGADEQVGKPNGQQASRDEPQFADQQANRNYKEETAQRKARRFACKIGVVFLADVVSYSHDCPCL